MTDLYKTRIHVVIPFPDCPKRPLHAQRDGSRRHDRTCPHAWVDVPPSEWTPEQRKRASPWSTDVKMWHYTPGCPGCDDITAWHQAQNARAHQRQAEIDATETS